MDRVYQSNAIETPPSSVASSGSYPTAGNKASGQLATVPGPYWFYSITEEIRNAIIAAGLTPDSAQVNQLAAAMAKYLPLSGGTMTGNISFPHGSVTMGSNEILFSGSPIPSLEQQFPVLALRNGNHVAPYSFAVCARNASEGHYLEGKVDGTLTWRGKNVVCVESWYSDENWYRKYSDGWIEQGGVFWGYEGYRTAVISFHTPFTKVPNVQKTIITTNESNSAHHCTYGLYTKPTTTSFEIKYWYGETDWFMWYACGY